jgi:hypothetical protein
MSNEISVLFVVGSIGLGVAIPSSTASAKDSDALAPRFEYAQNDDGSDVVVPPINNGGGQNGRQSGFPPNPNQPGSQGGLFFPPPLPPPPPAGNICYTALGGFPGPFNPVGTPCNAALPDGRLVPGRVGAAGQLPPILPVPGSQ